MADFPKKNAVSGRDQEGGLAFVAMNSV